ncbi:thioredoxin domain-containing protein [Hoyosella rhizosphaerae]|uniref:DsbA family protein n=1 Tax=Hoyosella rhizosphaerae TaxID=1755582 RepID=UPI001663D0A2|nr:thioredoxin domain-containing protein [Hoyosella rhizosphaerae]MBN4925927.1 thioredoxin domain-containing protein [Hoyosella rhizosphaerae]
MSSKKSSKKNAYTPEPPSNRLTYTLGGIALVLALIASLFMYLWQQRTSSPVDDGYGNLQAAEIAIDDNGYIRLGSDDAPIVIELYEDYKCEGCQRFYHLYGQNIARHIDEGSLAVEYRTLAILDRISETGTYSTRAAAAATCVANTGDGAVFHAFHSDLLEQRPRGREELSPTELADIARNAGADDNAITCITNSDLIDDAEAKTESAREAMISAGSEGTPTVVHNGELVSWESRHWLNELITGTSQ